MFGIATVYAAVSNGRIPRARPDRRPVSTPLPAVLPAVFAFLLFAAHAWRAGLFPVASVALVLAAVTLVRRPWAAPVAQVALVLASFEWIRTLFAFAAERVAQGRPWTRLAIILGAVTAFTLLAAWWLRSARAQRYFRGGPR